MTTRQVAVLAGLLLIGALVALRVAHGAHPEPPAAASMTPRPTRESAVRAAVSALYALSVPALTSRRRFAQAVRRLAAPGSNRRVKSTFGSVDAALRAAFRKRPAVLRGAPLGYRLERYSKRAASVAIWMVTLAATPDFAGAAQWRTLVVNLAWTTRGWKVTGGAGTSGPDPATPLRRLAADAARFRNFAHVP